MCTYIQTCVSAYIHTNMSFTSVRAQKRHTHAYIETCIHTYNCPPKPPPPHTQVALTQSMAIILFLEDAFPHCGPALLGEDVLTRAIVTEMAEIINSGIQPLQVLG